MGLNVGVWIVIVAVDFEEHFLLDEVLVLVVGHRRDALLDQLVQGLDIETQGDDLLLLEHLEESAHLHLSVLVFDVSLSQHDTLRIGVLMDKSLEKVLKWLHISQVHFDRLLGEYADGFVA